VLSNYSIRFKSKQCSGAFIDKNEIAFLVEHVDDVGGVADNKTVAVLRGLEIVVHLLNFLP